MKHKCVLLIGVVWIILCPPVEAHASPTTPKCATVEWRTEHLAECNQQAGPGFGVGGGGGSGRGIIGGILHRLPGVGGLF